ncbi:MAG: cytochrome c peroxidase [Chitinophagales bacterium]|nr:cytochrome c peroxidase [Chitinophagales bacterium]
MRLRVFAVLLLLAVISSCTKDPLFNNGDEPIVNNQGWVYNPTPQPLIAPPNFPPIPENADNPQTKEGILLGRMLFYDPILSTDSTISCGSCHKQANAFASTDRFSTGVRGQLGVRNSMPLFNLVYNSSFFWDGRSRTLEEQILEPVVNPIEMDSKWGDVIVKLQRSERYPKLFYEAFGKEKEQITPELTAKAIAQFLKTIISADSDFDKTRAGGQQMTQDARDGFEIYLDMIQGGDCIHCHGDGDGNRLFLDNSITKQFRNNGLQNAQTTADFSDVGRGGITNVANDFGKFKVPSLRNVALTAPYMHDGRFQTLEQVVDFYSDSVHATPFTDVSMEFASQGGVRLTQDEKFKVVEFLKSLTDYSLINNPDYSNPFE